MELSIQSGTYVVAVSGGVDSIALLHCLATDSSSEKSRFVVAHFDHGIREDSIEDRKLAQQLASQYRLPFVYEAGKLGLGASEDEARRARYAFLRSVKQAVGASMIVTAHHADDAFETAVFNLLRGTGRKGVSSLQRSRDVLRPMLHLQKSDIIKYAKENQLVWREDVTNADTSYSRNYIRKILLPKSDAATRVQLQNIIQATDSLNEQIDALLSHVLHIQPRVSKLDRVQFTQLPHLVAKEVLAEWLRVNELRKFDKKMIERLTIAIKTAPVGSRHDIIAGKYIYLAPDNTAVIALENKNG